MVSIIVVYLLMLVVVATLSLLTGNWFSFLLTAIGGGLLVGLALFIAACATRRETTEDGDAGGNLASK